jgi:hypothetical protein
VPHWDRKRRTLSWHGRILKEFRQQPGWQELLLTIFEEDGWPEEIDNPIPGPEARQRLRNAVQHLNKRQNAIAFHIRRQGTSIRWEVRVD